ncbi:MAG: UvrD-helicase domain-containing protein, partial [Kangiellaceae bacterium]|nr:UvrD-helicase domain-containing protein [Kangiellaceae bacterium]
MTDSIYSSSKHSVENKAKVAVDQAVRDRVINEYQHSFMIQAPAGSGKTDLLTKRILALLAKVDAPEEIVAITFTKKAAAEMQQRVVEALELGLTDEPDKPHEKITWRLARAVLQQDKYKGWGLLNNPNRLKISTIDSFCMSLAKRLPVLSGIGGAPGVSEIADDLYREAVEQLWSMAGEDKELSGHFAELLRHTGNDWDRVSGFLQDLLKKRILWIDYVARLINTDNWDGLLSATVYQLAEREIGRFSQLFSVADQQQILDVANYMKINAEYMALPNHPLAQLDIPNLKELAKVESLPFIQAFLSCLVTKQGTLAKRLNKNHGMPTKTDAEPAVAHLVDDMKNTIKSLLDRLSSNADSETSINQLLLLPGLAYSEQQLTKVESLIYVLIRALASLNITFSRHAEIDFSQVSLMAIDSLGHEQLPSDLALVLDASINHILIDEFQDTSMLQLKLLKTLTQEWQPGDGKTLFLVGDPM